ncbi:MAG: hypothetical protein Q9217_000978 [Psora testacea]
MPDAWDDDWIQKADSKPATPTPPLSSSKLSKAERRAKQAEFNRQLWEDAERSEDNFFLKTQGIVPLKDEFKPAMKVLSRKPTKPANAADGLGQLTLDDDDDDDLSEKNAMTPEERLKKAQKEREEKQKAYEERRRELFGNDDRLSSTASKRDGNSRNQSRANQGSDSRPSSAASNKPRQLFDPNDSAKPDNLRLQKKEAVPNTMQPVREPRAPDGSGRGGFGFAPRGGRAA